MMDFAIFNLGGRLTDDPVMLEANNGMPICKFSVATNRRMGQEEQTSYVPVTVFGEQATLCGKYLSKGRAVIVEGRFETNKYEDKEGNRRTGFCVVANHVTFGPGGKRSEDEDGDEEPVREVRPEPKSRMTTQKKMEKTWRAR